jgi:hypothetical protein
MNLRFIFVSLKPKMWGMHSFLMQGFQCPAAEARSFLQLRPWGFAPAYK